MVADVAESAPATQAHHQASFFRQSGWMMIATVAGGVLMFLVNFLSSKFIPDAEYAALGVLIQVLNWVTIPAIGLQTTFAQQTSAAITDGQHRQLVGTVRAVSRGIILIWLGMVAVTFLYRDRFTAELHLNHPAALWLTLGTGLFMLLLPIWQGLLQGRQNFLWLGWAAMFNALGRLLIGGLVVFLISRSAGAVMLGALAGFVAAVGVAWWQNRDVWHQSADPFEAGGWLRRVVPLSMACGASQFLFSADMIVVTRYFGGGGASAPYALGGTLARAIVLFTAPVVAVMFPKIVHSAARKQKSNLMFLALLGTMAMAAAAAIGLTLTSSLLIKVFSKPGYASIVPLIPFFAWSMVPLAVGNVLMNNLVAQGRFKCAPVLVAVAVAYWIALQYFHDSFKTVIAVLGCFNLIFLAVCVVFTWAVDRPAPGAPAPQREA